MTNIPQHTSYVRKSTESLLLIKYQVIFGSGNHTSFIVYFLGLFKSLKRLETLKSTVIVRENYLDLMFVASPGEKVTSVSDENYITYAIMKFMLDMPRSGSFQNIGL